MFTQEKLTEGQAERLHMLAEECAEVIQAVTKILRHGYDSYHPDQEDISPDKRYTNLHHLRDEIGDLVAVMVLMEKDDVISDIETGVILEKKLKYTYHQNESE